MHDATASEMLDVVAVGLQMWEATGPDARGLVLRWANATADRHTGFELSVLRDRTLPEIFPSATGEESWVRLMLRAALEGREGEVVTSYRDERVSWGWFRVHAQPLVGRRVLVTYENVTQAYERQRAIAASERLSADIIASLQEGILVVDASGRVTRVNAAAARLWGLSLGELSGCSLPELPVTVLRADGTPAPCEESPPLRALGGESVHGVRLQVIRRDGTAVWAEVTATPLAEPDGTPYGALATYVDVTERVRRERRMRLEAESDPLTGLANRRALGRALDAALERARATQREVAVLALDLDGFKAVNDRWGHPAGDQALREVARRLQRCVRERDVVARVGGDEFVIVLPDLQPGERAAERCAERVTAALASPAPVAGGAARLSAATGAARFPRDGTDDVALLAHADRALYAAKG